MLGRDKPSRRVIFTFDSASYDLLERLARRYGSLAEAVRASIRVNAAITDGADEGLTEVVLRTPPMKKPQRERVLDL